MSLTATNPQPGWSMTVLVAYVLLPSKSAIMPLKLKVQLNLSIVVLMAQATLKQMSYFKRSFWIVLYLKLLCKILLIFHLQLSVYLRLRRWLSSSHSPHKGVSFIPWQDHPGGQNATQPSWAQLSKAQILRNLLSKEEPKVKIRSQDIA